LRSNDVLVFVCLKMSSLCTPSNDVTGHMRMMSQCVPVNDVRACRLCG